MMRIRVPCSSANIGPGFDVVGLALSIWLELQVTLSTSPHPTPTPQNCTITYEGQGASKVDLHPERNLLTQTALYVLRCHSQASFPPGTSIHIINPIPLGRGLGSSGAAVVAGVILGNEVGKLGLSKARILDYCLMIERHPDNVAAALYGGFVGTYLNSLGTADMERKEIPLSEVLPEPAGGLNTGITPPSPPFGIGHYIKFAWAHEIKAVAIIPDFEVSTAEARDVLPKVYSRKDMIYNMQRIALLTTALGQSPPNPSLIYEAMKDKIHQQYRSKLIPGLEGILSSVTPNTHPGLLGICLSGAGPTILALATHDFEKIAEVIISRFESEGISCDWKLLEPADGAEVFRG
ncbi:MAG: Trihydroxynaphthalene reductase [Candelaria pacifica]|nr:MAG: Trihydroxynaphthalene reductase [Candelaria pacifica]